MYSNTYQLKSSCSTISPTASLTSFLSSGLGPGRVMRCAPHATVTSLGRTPLEKIFYSKNVSREGFMVLSAYSLKQCAAVTRMTGSQLSSTALQP